MFGDFHEPIHDDCKTAAEVWSQLPILFVPRTMSQYRRLHISQFPNSVRATMNACKEASFPYLR